MAEKNKKTDEEEDIFDDAVEETKPKEKKPRKSKPRTKPISIIARLKDERLHRVVGLVLLLVSFYLFVSFFSYLFTWRQDQVKLLTFSWRTLFTKGHDFRNLMGSMGAFVSDFFIRGEFGLLSFIIAYLLGIYGINLLLNSRIINAKKHSGYGLFFLVYFSVALSFIFDINGNSAFPFGGYFGITLNDWMTGFIGKIGMGALLVVVALAFAVLIYNLSFKLKFAEKNIPEPAADVPVEQVSDHNLIIEDHYGKEKIKEETPDPVITEKELDEQYGPEILNSAPESSNNILITNEEPVDETLDIQMAPEEPEVEENDPEASNETFPYDPTLDLSNYEYPSLDLLENYDSSKTPIDRDELLKNKDQIVNTLRNYNIEIQENLKATVGPTVALYEIVPAPGVRISKIKNLEDDIALSLSALGIRIIAPIPGKGTIGIEVPNKNKETVAMRSMLASEKFQNTTMELPIALGKNISSEIVIQDLTKMPHLLIAGATGQGKSVGINAILMSLLYKKHPSQLKFVLIDPKKVELSLYSVIEKHFLAKLPGDGEPIIVDTKKVIHTLNSLCIEMDLRYDLLKEGGVRNIKEYNEKFIARRLNPSKGHRFMPYIVLVIDEFADLIMTAGREVETPITRLAQLARAVGLHLIIATQRPSVNIITGTIKANFPARIAFKVTAKVDSRTILDLGGADQLIGRGDMLLSLGGDLQRIQCAFVDTAEVERVVEFIAQQPAYPSAHLLPEYIDPEEEGDSGNFDPNERDELFEDAARLIVQNQMGSTSLLQRRLKLGYNRAGRLMDQLEAAKIVGPNLGSKSRDVLVKTEFELEHFLDNMSNTP
jgi:DNA segregation ATPase FtsK/SpoIIIE, S-DNA-T family